MIIIYYTDVYDLQIWRIGTEIGFTGGWGGGDLNYARRLAHTERTNMYECMTAAEQIQTHLTRTMTRN